MEAGVVQAGPPGAPAMDQEMTSPSPSSLTAVVLSCSLKPSPARSSSELLGSQVLDALAAHEISGEIIRVADYQIAPGVEADMGGDDQWPTIRRKVLDADILVLATPTWMGQHSSVCQRVLERLDAELSASDNEGRPLTFGKVAVAVVVGNEDGAHHITGILFQVLNDVGFSLAAQTSVYWNGEAMHTTDYNDLGHIPDKVKSATETAAANAAHLAKLLTVRQYPAVQPG
jgi:multimeric flavodoxin WrbA